jgi:hypothetical protein
MKSTIIPVCLLLLVPFTSGFTSHNRCTLPTFGRTTTTTSILFSTPTREEFEFSFEMPTKGIAEYGTAQVKLAPVLPNSEIVVVRYDLPFGLNAAPSDDQIVVTKDGTGGEKVGDVLRQTTYWRGNTPGLYDVSKNADNFEAVIAALVTNDVSVTDEIVLVFERPL